MHSAEHASLERDYLATGRTLRASFRELAVLVDDSAADVAFTLAHWRKTAAWGAHEVARAALEHYREEHELNVAIHPASERFRSS